MARHFSKNDSTNINYSSPEGFWPIPRKEAFQLTSSPTWTVPKRRNSRKKKGSEFYFYDTTEEDICFSKGGEVTTKNRFSVLEDTSCSEKKESPTRSSKKEDTSHNEVLPDSFEWHDRGDILHATYDDYISDNFISCNSMSYKFIKYNMFMYINKYNLCSGYFPDFITLNKNVFDDIYNDNNFPRYYPYNFNGKYLKQISNSESKYNNKYFSKMKSAYDISKHIWGNPSPSSGIGTKGSGIGTQGEHINGRKSRISPSSGIGTNGSGIGTQGEDIADRNSKLKCVYKKI